MPENSSEPRPVPDRGGSTAASTAEQPAKPDLTVNKVLAGAGAAATSAVLGSFFGAAGTVAGAALGSVASTVAATVYQHSLDRTRDTVVARIRLTGGRGVDVAEPTPDADETVTMPHVPPDGDLSDAHVEPPVPARRRTPWAALAGVTVLVFVLTMGIVWGIEALKGSTLTRGETGTSIGRVFNPTPADPADDAADTTTTTTTSESSTEETSATPTPTSSAETSDESAPGDAEGSREGGSEEPDDTDPGEQVEPTQAPSTGSSG